MSQKCKLIFCVVPRFIVMKIIAGKLKGRTIQMPNGIRPTSDKVREAFFEIVKDRIEGANFLDLYCGSGAMGIEAFSRGAKGIAFVDNNFRCTAILRKNLTLLDISGLSSIHIYKKEALRALEAFKQSSGLFDIVFLDPPYYKDIARNTLIALSNCDILARNVVIITETYKKECLPLEVGSIKRFRTFHYGDTKLDFFGYTD